MTAFDPFMKIRSRLAQLLGSRPVQWSAVSGRTKAGRWVVRLANGTSVFVKTAGDAATAGWLRTEHRLYASVGGEFMPRLLGWDEQDESPILILEDLSSAHWPPPWTTERIDLVLMALERVRRSELPEGLPALREQFDSRRDVIIAIDTAWE